MIGDILFYTNKKDLPDTVIAFYEKLTEGADDFVHCAIVVSEQKKVEALWNGVVLSNMNNSLPAAFYHPLKAPDLALALKWIESQVGQAYGYGDLVDVLLQHPVFECHYDCSALAAQFLGLAGDPLVKAWGQDVHMITPQMLADRLGVKKTQ